MSLDAALGAHGVRVLFADDDLVIVDKPCGLPSQETRSGEAGVIDLLWRAGFAEAALHHRLDQPASGCLALSLSLRANPGLGRTFREHRAERVYHVILAGHLPGATTWERPLDGKAARTHVRPLATASGFTAAEVTLDTGRTHQIRRHAALAGHAVAGDQRHGGDVGRAWSRLALHAARLRLPHPVTGTPIEVAAPLPDDLLPLWRIAGGPG